MRRSADAGGADGLTSVPLRALLVRQEENLADALTRSPSPDAAAERGHASATWQREQMAWLRAYADALRAALATGASRTAD
jgi:hypothetical protein